ncbi:MAG TPA: hypothetical protein ENI86_02115 [Acidimicrobiales bacterium]|nr:hypothetical protein [Acidimicrobiales bacterium]
MGLRGSRWSALLVALPVAIGLWIYAGDDVGDVRARFAARGVAASETSGPEATVPEDASRPIDASPSIPSVAHPVEADAGADVVGIGELTAVFAERRFELESHAVLHLSLELLDAKQMEFFGLDPNPGPPTTVETPETTQEEGAEPVPPTSPPPTLPGSGRVSWYLVEGHVSYDISAFVCRPAEGWESCDVVQITDGDLRGFARRRGNQFVLRLEWVPLGRSGEPAAPALVVEVVDEKGFPFEVPVGDLALGLESSDLMGNGSLVTIGADTTIQGHGEAPVGGSMVLQRP